MPGSTGSFAIKWKMMIIWNWCIFFSLLPHAPSKWGDKVKKGKKVWIKIYQASLKSILFKRMLQSPHWALVGDEGSLLWKGIKWIRKGQSQAFVLPPCRHRSLGSPRPHVPWAQRLPGGGAEPGNYLDMTRRAGRRPEEVRPARPELVTAEPAGGHRLGTVWCTLCESPYSENCNK